jgi:large subunit ribosomal protein L30
LGIRRRGQTVFHAHSGASAGKILRVKELVKVENVTEDEVKTSAEMRNERKAVRGYVIKQRFKDEAGSSRTWMDGL